MIKNPPPNAGDLGSIPGSGRFPWRRKRQPTPVFLPGEPHGQRSLAGYSSWGRKKSDTIERPNNCPQITGITGYYCKAEPSCQSLEHRRSLGRGSRISPRGLFCLPTAWGDPGRRRRTGLFAGLGKALRMPSDTATALGKDPRFIPWCLCAAGTSPRASRKLLVGPDSGPLRRFSRRFLILDIEPDTEAPLPRGPAVPRASLPPCCLAVTGLLPGDFICEGVFLL